jgi:hypothetical protein
MISTHSVPLLPTQNRRGPHLGLTTISLRLQLDAVGDVSVHTLTSNNKVQNKGTTPSYCCYTQSALETLVPIKRSLRSVLCEVDAVYHFRLGCGDALVLGPSKAFSGKLRTLQ